MRCGVLICAVFIAYSPASSQESRLSPAQPNQFEIGRRTFFDFGPPFDFYEVFLVRPTSGGSSIERITLTPAGDECVAPAKIEIASASLSESPATLLGSTNLCKIPEKTLGRELKRCKNCLVFSGAEVVMQVQCGTHSRLIRSNILDKDMFDPAAHTPKHTSWTMQLLERLDTAVGPGVMDKPMFPISEKEAHSANKLHSVTLQDLSAGKYDVLFQGAPNKPSDLYRAAQNPPPPPSVRLMDSAPIAPENFVAPGYPPLARLAHVEGVLSFTVEIDANGGTGILVFQSGHPLLREAVKKAVSGWKFRQDASIQQIKATIEFTLNCSRPTP